MSDDINDEAPVVENFQECFEIATHFLGKEWLETKRKEHFQDVSMNSPFRFDTPPAVQQYARCLVELGYEEPADLIKKKDYFTEDTAKFVRLGEYIKRLSDIQTYYDDTGDREIGIPESIKHRLRKADYESARFELAVASDYVFNGYTPQLIEEGSNSAADIRLPDFGPLFVECKRVDSSTGASQDRQKLYRPLIDKIASYLDKKAIVILDLEREITYEEIKDIEKYLPKRVKYTKPQKVEAIFGKIYILQYVNPEEDPIIPIERDNIATNVFRNLLELEVAPAVTPHIGYRPEAHDFDCLVFKGDIQRIDNSYYCYETKTIGILYQDESDYIKQVLNQFDAARKKFDKSHPNILHIEVPRLPRFSREDIEELQRRLGGQLNVNSRVSAVAISTEIFQADSPGNASHAHWMGSMENYSPAVPLPENFEIPGGSLDELYE